MSNLKEMASAILKEFKADTYAFGSGVLDESPGKYAAELGKRAIFIGPIEFEWYQPIKDRILKSVENEGVEVVDVVKSAAPNAPFVDVYRIHSHGWRSGALRIVWRSILALLPIYYSVVNLLMERKHGFKKRDAAFSPG
jgi:hypothetical protein